jgi:hypothetical protein
MLDRSNSCNLCLMPESHGFNPWEWLKRLVRTIFLELSPIKCELQHLGESDENMENLSEKTFCNHF